MSDRTNIEWCDSTFNPWTGCSPVSLGCKLCYAEAWSKRAGPKVGKWGPGAPRVRTSAANWRKPLAWNAQTFVECPQCSYRCELRDFHAVDGMADFNMCPACSSHDYNGARRRVFCASLADVFDNEVPVQWRRDLFDLIAATPNLDWLLLTKRIGNARAMHADAYLDSARQWPRNVWLGATIVNQEEADRDIPKLLATPAAVRFLSMEPLLGPVDLRRFVRQPASGTFLPMVRGLRIQNSEAGPGGIDWVIAGGESGPGARPMHPDWARSLRDQCAGAGVPFLFKQWGEWAQVAVSPVHPEATRIPGNLCRVTLDGVTADHYVAISADGGRKRYELRRVGKKNAGRLLDGVVQNGFPRGGV